MENLIEKGLLVGQYWLYLSFSFSFYFSYSFLSYNKIKNPFFNEYKVHRYNIVNI